jgi:acyl-CoA thioester hydrolase
MSSPRASESTLRVRYAETDKMGVVYYANYLVWFEVARTEWLRQQGWTYRDMEADGFLLPVISAQCEYVKSALYDEAIRIRTVGVLHSPVRIGFEYEVFKEDGSVAARGSTMHAAVDVNGRPCRLPARVREVFA